MTCVRRLFVLLCGYEVIPKTVSTKDRGASFIMSEPISAYLLDTEEGWVLLDTGFDPAHIRDAQGREGYFYGQGMIPPVVLPEHEPLAQLSRLGLTPGDIGHVILTHLHFDHAGCVKYFPKARISIQRREYEARFSHGVSEGYIHADYDLPDLDWRLIEAGDWEVMPGLTMLDTRGHTEGHMSAIITLPNTGVVVLPFDAGDLQENFDEEILPGSTVDAPAAMAAILRIKQILAETGGRMILFHDPVAIQQTKLAPAFYD
jgi:N-acyl homoserine lactone hydrolase